MLNIAIHGIGDGDPKYYMKWKIAETLGVPAKEVTALYYEGIMDDNAISVFAKMAATAAASYYAPQLAGFVDKPVDYLEDIFVFFLSPSARRRIDAQLTSLMRQSLLQTSQIRVFAHSLGSVIAYWYFINHPEFYKNVELVTMGSPLGSRILSGLVKWWIKRLLNKDSTPYGKSPVARWINVSSVLDPLGGYIHDLGCEKWNQVEAPFPKKILHREVDEYVWYYRDTFYIEPDEPIAA